MAYQGFRFAKPANPILPLSCGKRRKCASKMARKSDMTTSACALTYTCGASRFRFRSPACGLVAHSAWYVVSTRPRSSLLYAKLGVARGSGRSFGGSRCSRAPPLPLPNDS
eukprot:7384511-Prymnesium_polylepis.3